MTRNGRLRRWLRVATPVAALAGVLAIASPAWAATVQVQDDANVLNATTVQNDAASLPVGFYVWTTTQDAASKSTFDTDVRNKVNSTFPIALGVNTQAHHVSVQISSRAGLSQARAVAAESSAANAFDGAMRGKTDYTAATTAAVDNLRTSLGSAGGSSTRSSGGGIGLIVVLVIVVIAIVAAVGFLRRRAGGRPTMMAGPPMGGGYPGPGYGPAPGYGPGPGYGQGYGPQYGPGYRSGMSPGAAGALGAVGGGLLGYELGKMEGQHDQYRDDRMMGGDNGGWDNSGQGGDWVTGQDGDFGGGGGDQNFGDSGGGGGGGDW